LGVDLSVQVAAAGEAARRSMATARAAVAGMRAAVAAFSGGTLGAARFLAEVGAQPALLLTSHLSRQDARERDALLARGFDPLVGLARGTAQLAPLLRSLGIKLYAGHGDRYSLAGLGIGHLHPEPPRARWGYEAARWAADAVAAAGRPSR
ncbi:MAG: hypothetical protein AB1609_12555, partial [Bacillota bacterium]